jgi:hypothetical protein
MTDLKFSLSKEQVSSLAPLFSFIKDLDGENCKTYWWFKGKESRLIVSGIYSYITFSLSVESDVEEQLMFSVDFEKIVRVLQSIKELELEKEIPRISVRILTDKVIFQDSSAKIKTKLPSSLATVDEMENVLSTSPRVLAKYFDEYATLNLDEVLLSTFGIAINGIKVTTTRNNSLLVDKDKCLYADIAQLYILPKGPLDFLSEENPIKVHRVTLELFSKAFEFIKKIDPAVTCIQPKISKNRYYAHIRHGDSFEMLITQRNAFLDIPTDEQLDSISPLSTDVNAIQFSFNVDKLLKVLKMFANVPSQESKRWGAISVSFNKDWGNKIHLSLYDYVAEVETDFDVNSITYPEGFVEYKFPCPTKIMNNFLLAHNKSILCFSILPSDEGEKSVGFTLTNPDNGRRAIIPKFTGKSVGVN